MFRSTSVLLVLVPFLFAGSLNGELATKFITANLGERVVLPCFIKDVDNGAWSFVPSARRGMLLYLGRSSIGENARHFLNAMNGAYSLEILGVLPKDMGLYRCQYFDGSSIRNVVSYSVELKRQGTTFRSRYRLLPKYN